MEKGGKRMKIRVNQKTLYIKNKSKKWKPKIKLIKKTNLLKKVVRTSNQKKLFKKKANHLKDLQS